MNIVVIGLGEVGRHLLSVLDKEGHDIVAVDASAKAVQYAEEHYDVASIVGYGASETVLKIAGVARADLVVAVTNHDEMNLIAALAAKQLGAKHVVARVQGTAWSEWTESFAVSPADLRDIVPHGRFLDIEATLTTSENGISPVLSSVDVEWQRP